MMSTSAGSRPNPIILMVPGAWHTPAAFDLLIPALAEHNYNALAVSLPSVDVSPGLPDFSEDVAAIRTAVEQHLDEKNRDVVLLMHSYGAIPGTEALRGLGKEERTAVGKKTGVVALVYVAAVVPAVGGTCFSASTDLTEEEKANQSRMRLVDNGVSFPRPMTWCRAADLCVASCRMARARLKTPSRRSIRMSIRN